MSASTPDALVEAYVAVSAANRRTCDKLTILLAGLHDTGVECLLLKGADLVSRLYGVWGLRTMADVDLLVHETDLPVIDRVLREQGYQPKIDGNPAYQALDHPLLLDLVTEIWYLDDQDAVWRRAVRHPCGGVPVLRMSAEDMLLFLTAYTVLHRGHFSATFAQDLALLIKKERLDWRFIVEEAGRCHLKVPLFHGLSDAVGHGAAIPSDVLAQLAPANPAERLLYGLLRRLVREEPADGLGHVLLFLTGRDRWRRLWRTLFPSPEFMSYRYGEAGRIRPLRTRIRRLLYLLGWGLRISAIILARLVVQPR